MKSTQNWPPYREIMYSLELCWEIRQLSLTVFLNPMPRTGWCLGFALHQQTSQPTSSRVISICNCCNTMAQHAAVEALTADKNDTGNPWRRIYPASGLHYWEDDCLGLRIIKPDGAFYIFAKIPAGYNQDSFAFLKDLSKKAASSLVLPLVSMERAMFAYLMQLAWKPSEKLWNDWDMIQSDYESGFSTLQSKFSRMISLLKFTEQAGRMSNTPANPNQFCHST